jgi:site-specific recombinase XerD
MASKYIRTAAAQVGLAGHTWHDLRHHHASVLLAEGVNPAKVAERLGHDLTTLLSTYAHVLPRDDDRVRGIIDATLGGSAEDFLRTEAG